MNKSEWYAQMESIKRGVIDAPDPWHWKFRRVLRRIRDFFRYDIHQGLRNLVLFFPVIWRWRGWSFDYDYAVFMRSIELHHRTLLGFHSSTNWKRDAAGMDLTLQRWALCLDEDAEHLLHPDDETQVWDLMHDHLKRNARGWWD